MAELLVALKKRFDKIYEEYNNDEYDGNYDEREVNNYSEIRKLVEKHINDVTVNDTVLNLLSFIDAYSYEYIYIMLLDHNYKFTNMIVLFNFFVDISRILVNMISLIVIIETIFNPEISQYFGKVITITDDDIDGILVENNKNILVREEPIDIENIFYNIKLLFDLSDTLTKDIYWEKIVLNYEERVNKSYKINSKEWLELSEHKKVLEKYRDTNYKLKYPIFKLEFVKYKKDFDDFLIRYDCVYNKTTNQIIYTKNNL